MNKKFTEYFTGLGFNIIGNNAYGEINGYSVSADVKMLDNKAPLKLHIALYASAETKLDIIYDIIGLRIKYLSYEANAYGILLGLNDVTVGALLKKMPNIIENIFAVFTKHNALGIGYCPLCGNEVSLESKKYHIDWALIQMDENCVANLNEVINEENKDFNEQPNNYIKGTVGALIGAVVGAIAYIVLFYIGFISALTAFVSVFLGAYLYKKLGGKPNKVMVLIVAVVSILSMLYTVYWLYLAAANVLAPEYGFSSEGLAAFIDMMSVQEFSSEFISNLGMTALFTFIGVFTQINQLSKSVKRQGTIK